MKWLGLALALLLQEPSPPESVTDQQARKYLAWLKDSDPGLQDFGRQGLRKLGKEAIPHVEARIKELGAMELVRVLRDLEQGAPSEAARWVASADLPSDEEVAKSLPKLEKGAADRYVHVKYSEALAAARRGNFQKGYDMTGALLTLEPKAAAAEWVRKLRRYCDNMILQTSLLEAKVVQKKLAYAADETVELAFRLKNIHRKGMTLRFDQAAGGPARGRVVLEIEVRAPAFDGSVVSYSRTDELSVEAEVPIAVGAQWERAYKLDTAPAGNAGEQLRIFIVNAWMVPDRIDAENFPITRRIQFEPAVVKVIPRRYERFVEKPLEALGTMIDTGTFEDVFVCALLLDGEAKDQGVELLISAMLQSKNVYMRTRIAYLLTFMTDQKLGDDPKKWEEWSRSRTKKPK